MNDEGLVPKLQLSLTLPLLGDGKDLEVMCIIIDSLGGQAAQQWFLICVFVNLLDLIVYTIVWILIKFKAGNNNSLKRVFRSLQVIMFSVTAGWLINAFVMGIVVPLAQVPVSQIYYFQAYFGFLPNLASATNVIPLYIFSSEYRHTIQEILSPIFPNISKLKVHKVTTVHDHESSPPVSHFSSSMPAKKSKGTKAKR